jgi:putative aldouronate transport system substrate-binding protein
MPGDAPARYAEVMAVLNEKLVADKNIRLEITYIPWDVWQQRVNLMLSTGEEFDLFHIMQDQVLMGSYKAMGGLTDITDLLDQYGPNIKRVVSAGAIDALRIDGRVYGIPAQWADLSNDDGLSTRKDVLDKYGIAPPTSPDDLLSKAQTIAANWDGSGKLYIPVWGLVSDVPFMHRTYSSWPFIVKDRIVYITEDGTVRSWIETDEFRQDTEWMHRAYQAGLIHPDALTLQNEQGYNIYRSGNWFFTIGGINSYYLDVQTNNNPNLKPEDYVLLKMNPEKPDVYPIAVKNLNGISSTSKHPEAAIKFVDWLYTNQDNYNLFMYGRSGVDYTLTANRLKDTVKDNNNEALYTQADWMVGNVNYMIPDSTALPMEIENLYTLNPAAIYFTGSDFFFDSAPVEVEWGNVMTEFAASITPICIGIQPYDTAFSVALRRMKAAGLDKIITEYQRQLSAHLAAKK